MPGSPVATDGPDSGRTLVIACGALARELRVVLTSITGLDGASGPVDVEYLPAPLHNRPEQIPHRVEALLRARGQRYDRVVVAYGDCGTGGMLDAVLARYGATRLVGAHCYEFFAGASVFEALCDAEPGTFYLTDFLARHFEALVWVGLGLDRHPELRDAYFGNYRRVVLLSQSDDPTLVRLGQAAADRLGLAFEHRPVGLGPFRDQIAGMIA